MASSSLLATVAKQNEEHKEEDDEYGIYTQETVQTDEDFMNDNVQTFINMGTLQNQYKYQTTHLLSKRLRIGLKRQMIDHDDFNSLMGTAKLVNPFQRRKPKKLLLLDMDETLLHAATISDIFG